MELSFNVNGFGIITMASCDKSVGSKLLTQLEWRMIIGQTAPPVG
jgi:hypothetical protein